MKLFDTDQKLVARLKKRQQQFIRWRWVGLLGATLCIGVGFYAFLVLKDFAQEPALPSVMAIAFLSPIVYLLQISGFGLLIYLAASWRGRPEVVLLLRLVDESQDDA